MGTAFGKAMKEVRNVIMFENWLRFYFIAEDENTPDKLFIIVPDQADKRIREDYPDLWPLLEELNNKEITPETSRAAVCTFVSSSLEGSRIPSGQGARIFDSSSFQFEVQLFNIWVQSHEEQLDQAFLDFGKWLSLFEEWRSSDKVKEYIAEMRDMMQRSSNPGATAQ